LATGLLCATITFAQTEDKPSPAQPPTQDQTGSTDRTDRKPGKPSDSATTKLKIRVTGNNDKPISNASVYVRFYTSGGFLRHDKLAELDLKTNLDGSVRVPEVPQGKILIQVIAKGWHTYGKWYDIEKDEESVAIKLEPPPHWY
jgi:hypothetical protein